MFDTPLEIAVAASAALIVYHHAVYPKLAAWLGNRSNGSASGVASTARPLVTVVMPAFNEAQHIAAKISNLAGQTWPAHKLQILIGCDGCTDNTVEIANHAAAQHPDLSIKLIDFSNNRGKVAVLNELVFQARGQIIIISDVSALLPANAISRLAAHFADPSVGAVGAGYVPASETTGGEKAYWDYQGRIKCGESRIGGLIGAHGSCYAIRAGLYRPLDRSVINDDFVVPMQIALGGWQTLYDADIRIRELQASPDALDFGRRVRIGRGNAQQLAFILPRLSLRRTGLAFAFLSGKGARVVMPMLMLFALAGSAVAAGDGSRPMALLLSAQVPAYLVAAMATLIPILRRHRKIEALRYLVTGHVASAIGTFQFIIGIRRGAWRRLAQA
jgi:hypothetical protein